ncbi:polysaccharide deacetylase family protein [Nocardia sp. IFM 10818]
MAAGAADAPPPAAAVFTRAYDTTTKSVTLTFDADWWSPGKPDDVVRILRDNGIVAGFSLTGRYVEKYPDQTRTLLAAGHKLINHSYDHPTSPACPRRTAGRSWIARRRRSTGSATAAAVGSAPPTATDTRTRASTVTSPRTAITSTTTGPSTRRDTPARVSTPFSRASGSTRCRARRS